MGIDIQHRMVATIQVVMVGRIKAVITLTLKLIIDMAGISKLSCYLALVVMTATTVNSYSQTKASTGHPKAHNKTVTKPKSKCTGWVNNLSSGDVHPNDICFIVTQLGRTDVHELHDWEPRKKTDEFWRFSVYISADNGRSSRSFSAAYYLYEETSELKQYHCLVDDEDCKAIIYDKTHSSWELVMVQDGEWKIISSAPSFHYLDAFGIKSKSSSSYKY